LEKKEIEDSDVGSLFEENGNQKPSNNQFLPENTQDIN
jgi:hypothetical protein